MAFPSSLITTNLTDVVATTLLARSGKIADNVTDNNAILNRLKKKEKVRPFSGGREIIEELSFADNTNGDWYSGNDTLPVAAQDVIGGAVFSIKQYACPVVINGLEELQNSGDEAVIDLLESRIAVAEASAKNDMATGLYSDGTGSGSKQIVGLDAAVPADPTTGTYGGINRATAANAFWRSQIRTVTISASNVRLELTKMLGNCSRGPDGVDLVLAGTTVWGILQEELQDQQRFTDPQLANMGFSTVKFMNADVVLDGGIGGNATATNFYCLNTNYIHYRPHKRRNFVPLKKRDAFNQDASVSILAWAGALTMSGSQFQGRITGA